MPKQPDDHDVVFYCDRCAQRLGRRRLLATADLGEYPQYPNLWRIRVARRAGRAPAEPGVAVATSRTGGVPHGERKRIAMQVGRRLALVPLHPSDPAAQLICRHCKARPRVARAKLVELAKRAVAAGRRDAYV